ncbi:hypothetical protein E2C01_064021 [Portunus trituberculatus]|uniref:Uncharacterized protein n=1 Tax=Portunus trituberculatus TaxID=210409 RepID=A0A5B7HC08_PORTR|nr:hypothetical protein [Portunus trituberculatus]
MVVVVVLKVDGKHSVITGPSLPKDNGSPLIPSNVKMRLVASSPVPSAASVQPLHRSRIVAP